MRARINWTWLGVPIAALAALAALAAVIALLGPTCAPLFAHRPVVLPMKAPAGGGARTRLLIGAKPGEHVTLVPPSVAFGDVRIGSVGSRDFEIRSVVDQPLHVELVAPSSASSEIEVWDPSTSTSVTAVDLDPLESRLLSVHFAPTSAATLAGTLEVRSFHSGLAAPVVDQLELSGFGRSGPVLSLQVAGTGGSVLDFGRVSRRAYGSDERPAVDVVIENLGDQTAEDLRVTFEVGSVPLGGGGCDDGSADASYCFYVVDADGTEHAPDGILGDLAANETVTVRVRIFAWQVSYADRSFQVASSSDPGVQPADLQVYAEIVPFFLGLPDSGGQVVQAADAEPGDGGVGRNVDPFASDPLSTFRPTGFDPKSLFDLGQLDAVDTQSGNMVLTIPIGGQQVARAGLSYALTAVYNSNVWARDTLYEPGAEGDVNLPPEDQNRNGNPADKYPASNVEYPNPIYNSSPGWSVHLGRLLPPVDWVEVYQSTWQQGEKIINTGSFWTYVSPSGTQQRFWPDLNQALPHFEDNLDELLNAEYLYERGGSFLRLHRVSATVRELEFPDGKVHVFKKLNTSGQIQTHPDEWVLTEMRDQHGNSITVTYDAPGHQNSWTIDDGNRAVRVELAAIQATHPFAVDQVVFPGFDGGSDRVFDFVYETPITIDRPVTSTWHHAFASLEDRQLTLQRLDHIDLPDGTSYRFNYSALGERHLLLESAELPTGATVHWDYDRVADTSPDCLPVDDIQALWLNGVTRRWVTEPAAVGERTLSETRYLRALRRATEIPTDYCESVPGRGSFEPYTDQAVGVWRAEESGLTSLTVEYFSKWPLKEGTVTGSWNRRERGVHMTRAAQDGEGRFLASELYSCSFGFGDPPAVPFDTLSDAQGDVYGWDPAVVSGWVSGAKKCTLLESSYSQYEVPITFPCEVSSPECGIGARVLSSKRFFATDPIKNQPTSVSQTNSHYDGVGHFRKTVTRSDFPDSPTVVGYTAYDATSGDLVLAADGSVSQDVALPTSPWVLGTYSMQWTRQSAGTQQETMGGEAHFTPDGLLRATRTWEKTTSGSSDVLVPGSAQRGVDDLVTLFEYSGNGELLVERHFGASTFTVPAGDDWWDAALYPVSGQDYATEYAYQSGVVSRKRVAGQSVFEVFREVDAATGWVKSETHNSGEVATFGYDPMGRLASSDSDRLADTYLTYELPGSGRDTWKVTVETYESLADKTAGEPSLTLFEVTYDGLGRVAQERARHPDSTGGTEVWSAQDTVYHPSGRIKKRSMLNNSSEFLEVSYDVKGRPISETLPGGDTVAHQYTGERIRNDLVWVNGSDGEAGATRSQVRYRLDAHGRVVKIEVGEQERSVQPGGSIATSFAPLYATTFSYSPRGDLQRAVRGSQVRVTTHDGRGFLTLENIPEKSTKTEVDLFDTRGNPLRSQEKPKVGGSVLRTVTGNYDLLGRPTVLRVDGRDLKRWTYAPACATAAVGLGAADLTGCTGGHGQMATAERFNYRTPEDLGGGIGQVCPSESCQEAQYRVATSFSYDTAGRPDAQELFVGYSQLTPFDPVLSQESTSLHVLSTQGYDALGRVTSLAYPCVVAAGGAPCTADRTVELSYDETLLDSVVEPGLGATFSYHLDGTVATVEHDGGTVDTYTADPLGRPRVSAIDLANSDVASGNPGPWSHAYSYDPAGNVTAIGPDRFTYDVASRLVDATVRSESYHYDYDVYDNVTNWGTVDTLTNRLVGGSVAYDAFGSLTDAPGGAQVRYDTLDKAVAIYGSQLTADPIDVFAVYDAADLRVFVLRTGDAATWTVRDFSGNLLREYVGAGSTATKTKDYVYAGSRLVASESFNPVTGASNGVRHYHQDHLGSARVVTGAGGTALSDFSPYGVQTRTVSDERVGFTGHENDGNGLTTYMKGRTYLSDRFRLNPLSPYAEAGRFLQVDPGRDGWNQYAYASGNPVGRIDPFGQEDAPSAVSASGYATMATVYLGWAADWTAAIGSNYEMAAAATQSAATLLARSGASTEAKVLLAQMARFTRFSASHAGAAKFLKVLGRGSGWISFFLVINDGIDFAKWRMDLAMARATGLNARDLEISPVAAMYYKRVAEQRSNDAGSTALVPLSPELGVSELSDDAINAYIHFLQAELQNREASQEEDGNDTEHSSQ